MYNHGKGEFITKTEYLRWKFRDNVKVRIRKPPMAILQKHSMKSMSVLTVN